MDYKETLPAGCPPAEALPAIDGQIIFRLVDANPATDKDFKSQRAAKPHARKLRGRIGMKTLQIKSTLYYYDGPQILELRDSFGGSYVGILTSTTEDGDQYLATGVSPESLRRFRAGLLDLRELLLEFGQESWYLSERMVSLDNEIAFKHQTAALTDTELLPDAGFILYDEPVVSEALAEARSRNNFVTEVTVTPPEAASDHRIRVNTYAGLLVHFQKLVKFAYGSARRELSLTARRMLDLSEAHLLDVVVPASEGSFRFLLESVSTPDMLGQSEVARAFSRIDDLFSVVADTKLSLEKVKQNRGHFAGVYIAMLEFLDEHKMGLQYSWADPVSMKSHTFSIKQSEVKSLVAAFSGLADVGSEETELVGSLEKADGRSGQWRLKTPEGRFSGKRADTSPSLLGLQIGNRYRFKCMEKIEEFSGTGRELRTLYLLEHEELA
jgi:hypothetical protein